ncbi:MAG TPA: hypothetical protein DEA55_00605 [Rhodospirillaceae bacterium]|nr:hypothetical protein [Rhodospirillaceae bacterium]
MFGDPEERLKKKLRRCTRNAVLAVGIGIGLLLLKTFYPDQEGAEHITKLFGTISLCLIFYGGALLAAIIFKRAWAPPLNTLLTWFVVPSYLLYVFAGA